MRYDNVRVFWQIDQYGNPWSVLITPTKKASFCLKYTDHDDDEKEVYSDFEITEDIYWVINDEKRMWKEPDWPKKILYGAAK